MALNVCAYSGCKKLTLTTRCNQHPVDEDDEADIFEDSPIPVPVKNVPILSAVPSLDVSGRRCQAILACRGTQCKTSPEKNSTFCKRHRGGSDGLVPNDIEPGVRSKTLKERVAAWDEKHCPSTRETTVVSAITDKTAAQPSTPHEEPHSEFLEPVHITFVVDLNKPEDWIKFGWTWSEQYKDFTICNFEQEPCQGIHMKFAVMLEKP